MTERDVERFWQKVRKQGGDGCWLWTDSKNLKGYGRFWWVNDAGDTVKGLAHRVSWELHHGPIPEKLCVLHTCDAPACIRPEHLWLGTPADNVRDMDTKGRRARLRGVQNANAKLTDEKVREILALVDSGMSDTAAARQFGVDRSLVGLIRRGKNWKHVERCPPVQPGVFAGGE